MVGQYSSARSSKFSYKNYGKFQQKLSGVISAQIYDRVNYRSGYPEYEVPFYEVNLRTFPLAIHNFKSAKVCYWYTYERRDKKTHSILGGSSRIPVEITLEFKRGRWVVVDSYEVP